MTEYIRANIPQLPVLSQPRYSVVSKKFRDIMDQAFLLSYLSEKFTKCSIKHHEMNEQLIKIFLLHATLLASRANEEMYSMDDSHYRQLFLTEQVCQGIASTVAELFYSMYFMKQLQVNCQIPVRIDIASAIEFAMNNIQLKDGLHAFSTFVWQSEEIRNHYNLNTVRPGYDYLITEPEPMYFVTSKNGTLSKHLLRKYIEEYSSFFHNCRHLLRHHSPDAIGVDLEILGE